MRAIPRKVSLCLVIILPSVIAMAVFGHFSLQDWGQLQQDYAAYKALSETSVEMPALFKANASQMIQRINLFADGTWFLLSAAIGAIGFHGFCTGR